MTGCLSLRINFLCKLEVSASFFSYISFMATAAYSQLGAVFTQYKTDMATVVIFDVTKGPWHTNTVFQDRVVLGLFLSSGASTTLSPVRTLLHLMAARWL